MLNAALCEKEALSPMDRFHVVADSFALVQAGKVPVTNFLDIVKQLAPIETDLLIWQVY